MKTKLFVLTIVGMVAFAGCAQSVGAPASQATSAAPAGVTEVSPMETPAATAEAATSMPSETSLAPAATAVETQEATTEAATSMPSETSSAPAATAVETPVATSPTTGGAALATPSSWQRVKIPPINIAFDVPSGWQQMGTEWSWSPNGSGVPRVGVNWTDTGAGWQPSSMLPANSQILQNQSANLGWATATQYNIQVTSGSSTLYETHMIAQIGTRAYDLFAVGSTADQLNELQPVLQHMLSSVSLQGS